MKDRQINFNTKDAEIVTKEVDGEEEDRIKVPISSTSTDRDGDEFSERGLESIVQQVENSGVPIFGNHGMDSAGMLGMGRYDWKDIIATAKEAEMEDETVMAFLKPNKAHYDGEGEMLADYIEEEQAVGFSVGFSATEKEEKERGEGNFVFHDVDLMETSAVGIPSNPDGMATAKEFAKETGIDEEEAGKLMQVAELLASSDVPDIKDSDMSDEDKTIEDVLKRLDEFEKTVEERLDGLEERMPEMDDEDEGNSDELEEEGMDEDEEEEEDEEEDEEEEDDKSARIEELEERLANLESEEPESEDYKQNEEETEDKQVSAL